jgi:hypothetical protein
MKKNSIARKGFLTALSLCLLVFAGCHSHEDSATMKEARALNAETTEVGRKFHDRLDMIREDLEAQLAGEPGGLAPSFESALATLSDLDSQYDAWMSNQILLPGQSCNHDHADGEHHHHHHEPMDDLSDADHLALQKAIRAELDGLVKELNSLKP